MQQQQQQKSFSNIKKKKEEERKKNRKRRAFKAKTSLILDAATTFANFKVDQEQVKQAGKTVTDIMAGVHANEQKRLELDVENDKNKTVIEVIKALGESALQHNEQIGLYQRQSAEERAITTNNMIVGAEKILNKTGDAIKNFSEEQKKATANLLNGINELKQKTIELQNNIEDAKRRNDREKQIELEKELRNTESNLNKTLDDTKNLANDALKGVRDALEQEKKLLDDLEKKIRAFDTAIAKGFGELMNALKGMVDSLYNKWGDKLKKERHVKIYWCINIVNPCRTGQHNVRIVQSYPNSNIKNEDKCWLGQVTDVSTGEQRMMPLPCFCHEGTFTNDFQNLGEQATNNFSEIFEIPISVFNQLLKITASQGVLFADFLENDYQYMEGPNQVYYIGKIRGAMKLFFTPDVILNQNSDAKNLNKLFYQALQNAIRHVFTHGPEKK